MWRLMCDKCLHTETLWTDEVDSRDCPVCGVGELLGPFAVAPRRFTRRTEWELLTSPNYRHAGTPDEELA